MTATADSRADDWLETARQRLEDAPDGPEVEQVGRVEQVGDGIAHVSGLAGARADELLRFQGGGFGFVHTLEPDRIACVLLDSGEGVEAGHRIRGTGDVVRVPVGKGLLGRVVDPLGRPLDGEGPIGAEDRRPIDRAAPGIIERDLVEQPVQTGVMVVDALFPIGRGQRELIIGDRSTGKSTLAIDTIINQRDSDIVCVYVSIGQKTSSVRRMLDAVRSHGAPERCLFVIAAAASLPGLQWIAPFAGMTMAEHFRDAGGHALIVLDDLSLHAQTHREIALLTHQSPGREAYPGDVFHLHARMLERAAKLSEARGSGSLTALPVAVTEAGNLSAYIPTNLISITDGQIVLDASLFHRGQKPAVDVGKSVSRVGGKTQAPALRKAADTLRLDYAQFLELESFTRYGGMPDKRVRRQLTRGAHIRAALAQPQNAPMRLCEQVALAMAVQGGLLDEVPPEAVPRFREGLGAALDEEMAEAAAQLDREGTLGDDARDALRDLLKRRVEGLRADGNKAEAGAAPEDDDDEGPDEDAEGGP